MIWYICQVQNLFYNFNIMTRQNTQDEDLLIINDSADTEDNTLVLELEDNTTNDVELISFGDDTEETESSIELISSNDLKNPPEDNSLSEELSLDLGSISLDTDEIEKSSDEDNILFSDDISADDSTEEDTTESSDENLLDLSSDSSDEDLSIWNDTPQSDTSTEEDLDNNSILEEAITKLERRKWSINETKNQKIDKKTSLLAQIESLQWEIWEIDNEIGSYETELNTIAKNIDSLTKMKLSDNN